MDNENLIDWYQKKIGTYDQEQWEKVVEEYLIPNLEHINLKTAKPRADLIDLDLVRGSSFTKNKPKHGFFKVARLSVLRCFLLPLYSKWWVQQISGRIFAVLLLLYLLECFNIAIYLYNIVPKNTEDATDNSVPVSELFVPIVMMLVLTYVHSQIVATSPSADGRQKSKLLYKRYRRPFRWINRQMRRKQKPVREVITGEHANDNPISEDGSSPSENEKTRIAAENRASDPMEEFRLKDLLTEFMRQPLVPLCCMSDSDTSSPKIITNLVKERRASAPCDTDDEDTLPAAKTVASNPELCSPQEHKWFTNSEESSYTSESDNNSEVDDRPQALLNESSDRVTCAFWEDAEWKQADLTVIEISYAITRRVERMPESRDYYYLGIMFTSVLALLPLVCHLCSATLEQINSTELQITLTEAVLLMVEKIPQDFRVFSRVLFGNHFWEHVFLITAAFQRGVLGFLLFLLLAVAERTFKQRFLYAKLFCHLTSSRRARNFELPHFRLNKVRNIKAWLSVRSYLKKRGPQRSVDMIVSVAFIANLLLLSFLCIELMKESFTLNSQYNLEILVWIISLGVMNLRFMTLGVKINKKYRNLSVLITEQINQYLQIEKRPHKKEELMVANNVLKLAADLLKELESQFQILGLSANPFLYNVTKVVILSALSGVLSEILGFKLKLHKIKIK